MWKEHLIARGLNPSLYDVSWDDHEVVFKLHNITGKLVGLIRYRPEGDKKGRDPLTCKYKPSMPRGTIGFFGVESLAYPGPVYLVEGIFKAVKLHRIGRPSLAICGSDASFLKDQLFILGQHRRVFAIGDGDEAGAKFVDEVGRGFTSLIDLDEMEDEKVAEMLEVWENGLWV